MAEVQAMIRKYDEYTGSERPLRMLRHWEEHAAEVREGVPERLPARARDAEAVQAGRACPSDEAIMAAFEENCARPARSAASTGR